MTVTGHSRDTPNQTRNATNTSQRLLNILHQGTMRYLTADSDPAHTAVVVFAADDAKLRRLDVGLGPCVIASGQGRPLVSPLMQDLNETPEQSSALFSVLAGGEAADALRLVAAVDSGKLFACNQGFLNAMADASEAMLAAEGVDGFAAEQNRLSEAWLKAIAWPDHYVGLQNRLHRLADARVAREKGLTLYFWFGPAVEMRSVVAGVE